MPMRGSEAGTSELVRLTQFLLDTAKVEDLAEMLQAVCPTPSRKTLLAQLLVSSTASSLQQMLGMLHADLPTAAQLLVKVVSHIEGECPIQLKERPGGGFGLAEEKSVQGAISRVVSLDIGDTCEKYAADLVRMGVQLPLWTSRDMARFSSSPSLQEKVVSWFVASLSDQLLVLLQGCCMVSELQSAVLPDCEHTASSEIVAESLAAAEVFRECLLQSTALRKSRTCVESLLWELLEPKSTTSSPHCEERFGCILGGALEAQVRHVETLRPNVRLHSLWRLASVVLTWRYLAESHCEDRVQVLTFLTKPGCYESWRPGGSAKQIGKVYYRQVIAPMMEEEERAWCEVAERAANKAMAELLAEPEGSSKRKAKRGKKSDAGNSTNGAAYPEEAAPLIDEAPELEPLIRSWQRLTAQLLMMASPSS
ncbi:unnamed protein product [Effrenium voratum]|uniref:Uncharacterized protein n=1 Tax=Effrenium voratum TaxID=2562239 RepID=A0AA36JNN4_9DINO|nr:unnamed protein product [Effrenium voratum]CAJ1462341.1 unnamed protein product [Effrenium voratum]